jgi:hypothetical protein
MEIRIVVDVPKGAKRRVLMFVVTPIALVAATALVARATVLSLDSSWVQDGGVVSASSLASDLSNANSNFATLDQRVAALESHTTYYAEQTGTGSVLTSGTGNWIDLPGVTVSFATTQTTTTLDLLATGAASTDNASGSPICAFQFVLDGTSQGAPNYGNRLVQVSANGNGDANFSTMYRTAPVSPGNHVVKLQMSAYDAASGNCACGGLGGLAKLLVTTH